MKSFVCSVCGYVYVGEEAPEFCPQCKAPKAKFVEKKEGEALVWADEHRIGSVEGIDPEVVEGLRANFNGECTEVGMYLAMSRQADREGYPEVAEAYIRIAFEEAEHAAKFAELLGEVVVPCTKTNLKDPRRSRTWRDSRKLELAKKAKALGYEPFMTPFMKCAKTKPATAPLSTDS